MDAMDPGSRLCGVAFRADRRTGVSTFSPQSRESRVRGDARTGVTITTEPESGVETSPVDDAVFAADAGVEGSCFAAGDFEGAASSKSRFASAGSRFASAAASASSSANSIFAARASRAATSSSLGSACRLMPCSMKLIAWSRFPARSSLAERRSQYAAWVAFGRDRSAAAGLGSSSTSSPSGPTRPGVFGRSRRIISCWWWVRRGVLALTSTRSGAWENRDPPGVRGPRPGVLASARERPGVRAGVLAATGEVTRNFALGLLFQRRAPGVFAPGVLRMLLPGVTAGSCLAAFSSTSSSVADLGSSHRMPPAGAETSSSARKGFDTFTMGNTRPGVDIESISACGARASRSGARRGTTRNNAP